MPLNVENLLKLLNTKVKADPDIIEKIGQGIDKKLLKQIQKASQKSKLTLPNSDLVQIGSRKPSSEAIGDSLNNLHKLINKDAPRYVSNDFDVFAKIHVNLQKGFELLKKFTAKRANS